MYFVNRKPENDVYNDAGISWAAKGIYFFVLHRIGNDTNIFDDADWLFMLDHVTDSYDISIAFDELVTHKYLLEQKKGKR